MAKLRFRSVLLQTLLLLTLTLFAVALADNGLLAPSKLGRSIERHQIPLRFKFKDVDPAPEEDCNNIPCVTGDGDTCDQSGFSACLEGYDICSNPPPPVDCFDIECTTHEDCSSHPGCGLCAPDYPVCLFSDTE